MKYGTVIDPDGNSRAADLMPDGTVWYANGGKCDFDTAETFTPYRRTR